MNDSTRTLDIVVFRANGYRLGLEAHYVRASAEGHEASPDSSIEHRLGWSSSPSQKRYTLHLNLPGSILLLHVAGPLELLSLPVESLHPLPPIVTLAHRLKGFCAVALPPGQDMILLFDGIQLLS